MRVRVIKRFTDLKENESREVNDEFEATKTRVEEINSARNGPFVKVIEEKIDYNSMTKKEIKEKLKEKGIEFQTNALKDELVQLLEGGE